MKRNLPRFGPRRNTMSGKENNRRSTILIPLLFLLSPRLSPAAPVDVTPTVHVCKLELSDGVWKGPCGRLGGEFPTFTIKPVKAITTGTWRKSSEPSSAWAGDIRYSDDVVPIEIEIHSGGKGVLRSADGWFLILRTAISGSAMEFDVDFDHEVPPSDLDREIVQRATAILSSELVWNRADTRECSPVDKTWSIYCAMEKATIEITGGFHHRRPALQIVRKIVEERSAAKPYKHRLMDYNNDPATRFADVQTLFVEALRRSQ